MAISDRLMSIANMTRGAMSDKDRAKFAEMAPQQLSPSQEKELEEFRKKFLNGVMSDKDKSMPTRSPDGSLKAREVEVAGEFEDMLMKNYEAAVEQGYKGTFFDFLIDQMDEEFDPASPMRVSRLKGIPSVMDMKMLTDSMPTGPMADTKEMLSRIKKILG